MTASPFSMTIRQRLDTLAKQRAALDQTIAGFEAERDAALAALPELYGHNNLNDFIKELKVACRPSLKSKKAIARKTARRRSTKVPHPSASAMQTTQPSASQPPAVEPTAVTTSGPTGNNLADPHDFGLLPDVALLGEATSLGGGYYDRLGQALKFAREVLGTSGVPASVWREWRSFEQKAGDILRNRHQQLDPEQS